LELFPDLCLGSSCVTDRNHWRPAFWPSLMEGMLVPDACLISCHTQGTWGQTLVEPGIES
jgi:hypothetical protein